MENPTGRTCEAPRCVVTLVTNELSAVRANDWRTTVRFTPFTHIIYFSSTGCTKLSPKYGSVDTSAAINGVAQWEIVELSDSVVLQWRRLLPESVICSARQFIFLLSLQADIMSFQYVHIMSAPPISHFFLFLQCVLF